jgi:hypothetical protein
MSRVVHMGRAALLSVNPNKIIVHFFSSLLTILKNKGKKYETNYKEKKEKVA